MSSSETVPFAVIDRTYQPTPETAQLLQEIGGVEALKRMTSIFYTRVFRNPHLKVFFHNEQDPHAERLANWVAEKMGGVTERELQDFKKEEESTKQADELNEEKKAGPDESKNLNFEEEINREDEVACTPTCEEDQCPFVSVRGVTKSGIKQCPIWIAKHPWTYEREVHRPMIDAPIYIQNEYNGQMEETTTVVHDRSSAHFAGWHCIKRPKDDIGQHFMLDDCRAWMRLHFWACRSAGLFYTPDYHGIKDIDGALTQVNGNSDSNKPKEALSKETQIKFEQWYTRFLGHFVRVYERQAPPFTLTEAEWSADVNCLRAYVEALEQGLHGMEDVVDVTFDLEAIGLMEPAERRERVRYLKRSGWPYNTTG
uniref:Uncharacterized protein n=1 Tax=Leptocylindrus danicus TaxID=163516 RepID=A0A7S2NWF0_9STRA|mmetsp:Transcript_14991/g.22131  ORF Transcript_14991/g.22131 Transcript_14991/m.22131 type:complete len:369 (+) Transcript_14991:154-1260(+)|eukprot:CAMPEP_0116009916 /NCGR_PEP_ID=MMETSP0321-20121206/3706_1 /TAXON_ID=163516 /ORGANISM="Leptocylindrus danicus var. danicus, Strain B650" /LENGTH=368 /DNA_ID=CAMNT_0003478947 /DNA_START=150 /DNA_END=1256 /DNA_ORIENTATION=+